MPLLEIRRDSDEGKVAESFPALKTEATFLRNVSEFLPDYTCHISDAIALRGTFSA